MLVTVAIPVGSGAAGPTSGGGPISFSMSISRTWPVKCLRALTIQAIAAQQDHDPDRQRRVVEGLPGEFVVPGNRQPG